MKNVLRKQYSELQENHEQKDIYTETIFVPLESNLMFATEAMFNILLSYLKQ